MQVSLIMAINLQLSTVAILSGHCFYLNNLFVFHSLSDLEKFIRATVAGLSQQVKEGDYSTLVEVMGHLLGVKERQTSTDTMFEPLQQTIALLKMYEQEPPEVVYKHLAVRTQVLMLYAFFGLPGKKHCFWFV